MSHFSWVLLAFPLTIVDHSLAMDQSSSTHPYQNLQNQMVKDQLRARGIHDERVLRVMGKVPRHEFVPLEVRDQSYADGPLPIGQGQTISQPFIVALMTQMLDVSPNDRVLEIGTGSGYQAAVLAELAKEVHTIEIIEDLAQSARKKIEELGYKNVSVYAQDGWAGLPDKAPFDKIIVTAAAPQIPEPLWEQLKEGGMLAIPLGEAAEVQELFLYHKINGSAKMIQSLPVRFVPFVHNDEEN